MIPHSSKQFRHESVRRRVIASGVSLALLAAAGCSSGVAPSKTAGGAGTGAMIGGAAGAVAGNNSSMGTGTGLAAGAALGAITGGIIGMVQDAKDRKEQDRLAQERAYQQELAKKRAEEAKTKAALEEELAIAEGFRISDLELNDAKKKQESTSERLKRLQEERSGALAKKKALDEAHEKTLSMEAEIARIEEELARLKGEEGQRKPAAAATPVSKSSQ
ncbi:MAG: hypothetical protein JNK23_02120 [Opitutaceae bacterium]|nr:hypothetical protein [Opitutaceae bacterium]